jgi:malonyl-CoA O-methyltransferase
MSTDTPPTLDPQAARRWQQRLHSRSAWLHEEVARRMQERLDWVKRQPACWIHWAPVRAGLLAHGALQQRYPAARCFLVEEQENSARMASQTILKPWWHPARWRHRNEWVQNPPDGVAQMLWANMALHMEANPQALMARWHRALAVDGFLMFSCLGPDTLRELRALYQHLGWPAPAHEFTDMHDWGDMLIEAGFAEPVMDMERITLSFQTPERLLQELRELGRNLHPARFSGLRGRGWLGQLHQALVRQNQDPSNSGDLVLTFEVIYGHAFKPQARMPVAPQTVVTLDNMRLVLQRGQVKIPPA